MACFLMAWEIGGGLGHTQPLGQVAAPLLAQGHTVHFVLRDLSSAHAGLGALARHPGARLWQAPLWLPPLAGAPPAASYAELLFHAGYLRPEALLSLVQAWRSLFDAIAPDLLLADHAPTALLAARGRPGMRRALIGSGFFQPPAQQPLPSLREWERVPAQRLAQSETRVLDTCNAVLAAMAQPPLQALHELLSSVDDNFLLTWPELDHYAATPAGRPGATYWGWLDAPPQGAPAVWPAGEGPPLLAYLRGNCPNLEALLAALASGPQRTLAYVPGLAPALRQRFAASAQLRISDAPVAMAQALPQARALLCHGGTGTVGAALQAGLPLLLLPMQPEQMLVARRVLRCGAGEMLTAAELGTGLRPALARVLADGALRDGARQLAQRHPPGGPVADAVARRCLALVDAPA